MSEADLDACPLMVLMFAAETHWLCMQSLHLHHVHVLHAVRLHHVYTHLNSSHWLECRTCRIVCHQLISILCNAGE